MQNKPAQATDFSHATDLATLRALVQERRDAAAHETAKTIARLEGMSEAEAAQVVATHALPRCPNARADPRTISSLASHEAYGTLLSGIDAVLTHEQERARPLPTLTVHVPAGGHPKLRAHLEPLLGILPEMSRRSLLKVLQEGGRLAFYDPRSETERWLRGDVLRLPECEDIPYDHYVPPTSTAPAMWWFRRKSILSGRESDEHGSLLLTKATLIAALKAGPLETADERLAALIDEPERPSLPNNLWEEPTDLTPKHLYVPTRTN